MYFSIVLLQPSSSVGLPCDLSLRGRGYDIEKLQNWLKQQFYIWRIHLAIHDLYVSPVKFSNRWDFTLLRCAAINRHEFNMACLEVTIEVVLILLYSLTFLYFGVSELHFGRSGVVNGLLCVWTTKKCKTRPMPRVDNILAISG